MDPETRVCSDTPRFSYGGSETGVRAVSHLRVRARQRVGTGGVRVLGGYRGGYTGWVIPGSIPSQLLAWGASLDSEAGPGRPCRGREWVVKVQRARAPGTTLRARSVWPASPPCTWYPLSSQTAVQTAKRREFSQFSIKLVKMTKCHRNMSIRPLIVPVLKTASESRLLIFWDFLYRQPSLTRN